MMKLTALTANRLLYLVLRAWRLRFFANITSVFPTHPPQSVFSMIHIVVAYKRHPKDRVGIQVSRKGAHGPIMVTDIDPNGIFRNSQLRQGMEIRSVNDIPCKRLSVPQFFQLLEEAKSSICIVACSSCRSVSVWKKRDQSIGLQLTKDVDDGDSMIVTHVQSGGLFSKTELKAGMELISINGSKCKESSVGQFVERFKRVEGFITVVYRPIETKADVKTSNSEISVDDKKFLFPKMDWMVEYPSLWCSSIEVSKKGSSSASSADTAPTVEDSMSSGSLVDKKKEKPASDNTKTSQRPSLSMSMAKNFPRQVIAYIFGQCNCTGDTGEVLDNKVYSHNSRKNAQSRKKTTKSHRKRSSSLSSVTMSSFSSHEDDLDILLRAQQPWSFTKEDRPHRHRTMLV